MEDIWGSEKLMNGLCACVCTRVYGRERGLGSAALRRKGLRLGENKLALDIADGGGGSGVGRQGEDIRDPKQQTCQEMRGRIKGEFGSFLFGGEGVTQRGRQTQPGEESR